MPPAATIMLLAEIHHIMQTGGKPRRCGSRSEFPRTLSVSKLMKGFADIIR